MPTTAESQRLTKTEATDADVRVQPGLDPSLDAAQERFRRGDVLLAREQQGDIDRNTGEDGLFDRGQSFGGPGNLDHQIRTRGAGEQALGRGNRRGGIVGEKRRHFERHPPVDAARSIVDRPKQVGGACQVLDRQLEEQRFPRLPFRPLCGYRRVVGGAVLDGLLEDRRV